MSGNDRCHYLLFRIRFLSSQRTHNFFGISISPFLPVLYFNNLCNNCHSDLCRCLRSDIQTDRCIHCIQHLLIHAFFRQTLFYQCCSSAASDHTDIGMLFCSYFLQTDLVIPVSSRQDHKIRIRTSLYLVQCFFEWFTDNLWRPGHSCMIRIHRTIFQYNYLTVHHHCHFNHRNRHMTGTTDHNLFFLSQCIAEYFLISNIGDSTFCNILYLICISMKITIFPAFPDNFSIYDQCLFRNVSAAQQSKHPAFCLSFTFLNRFH